MKIFFTFFCGIIGIVFILVGSLFVWSELPRTRLIVCGRTDGKTIDRRTKSAVFKRMPKIDSPLGAKRAIFARSRT